MFFYRNGTITDQIVGVLAKSEIEQRINVLLSGSLPPIKSAEC